ncbi:MAG: autotransporter outer membrane beta-barrel domain-containing protein [Pseudomonadota bacterium]
MPNEATAQCTLIQDGLLTRVTCSGNVTEPLPLQAQATQFASAFATYDNITTPGFFGTDTFNPTVFVRVGRPGGSNANPTIVDSVTLRFRPSVPGEAAPFEIQWIAPNIGEEFAPIFVATNPIGGANGSGNGGQAGINGGTAGAPMLVLIDNTSITSEFTSAIKILGMSGVGGNGGTGRNNAQLSFGGDGGRGGSGTTVQVEFDTVTARTNYGDDAVVIISSLGSDGGNGGAGITTLISRIESVGGRGGDGGRGQDVTVTIEGGLEIEGTGDSIGLFVSSEGGAGGRGGNGVADHILAKSTAGNGGAGGDGGIVTIRSVDNAPIKIRTVNETAILAESIGNPGADGGQGQRCCTTATSNGGNGGEGGDGDLVSLSLGNNVDIATEGEEAFGILVRSYGGDGGDGGSGAGGSTGRGGAGAGSGPAGDLEVSGGGSISTMEESSSAILAQSVGGFSGDAGSATGGIVTYGGSTESAGGGGSVTIVWNNSEAGDGLVSTNGAYADAFFAQSQGGGGGKGAQGSGIVDIGSDGSAGGDGGPVSVTLGDLVVITHGNGADGINAASIGGGGGDAGASTQSLVGIGGSGAAGGNGGQVTVVNEADIFTEGEDAVGILAQSVGLGGGSGDSVVGIVAIGGDGGGGGDGGTVTVTNGGSIATEQDDAVGVLVSSTGGGGGRGSSATAIDVGFSQAVGGSGDTGGSGGDVSYFSTGNAPSITTAGDFAGGVVVSSLGGGGGRSGNTVSVAANVLPLSVALAVGGDGAAGGSGGTALLEFDGNVETVGDNSPGLFASSEGGGGGQTGSTIATANAPGLSVSLAMGGSGGPGGDGGRVTLTKSDQAGGGVIATKQNNSPGVTAQSLGGGGGDSGLVVGGAVVSWQSISLSLGGSGGDGGRGEDVTVESAGSITTRGENSSGIVASSVARGGGSAKAVISGAAISSAGTFSLSQGASGGEGGAAGKVTVTSSDLIETHGDLSDGIFAQSVGGGGGSGSATIAAGTISVGSVGVTLGGDGGSGGSGDDVSVTATGDISTMGAQSAGISATSSSTGGGSGGLHFSGDLIVGGSLDLALGSAGGAGGTAGNVVVASSGDISTGGQKSAAISAMSLGGDGGDGGISAAFNLVSLESVTVTVGGDGGNAGRAGNVEVTNEGSLKTVELNSPGIEAISSGGDGGSGGLAFQGGIQTGAEDAASYFVPLQVDVSVAIGGDGGAGAQSGTVKVTNNGGIETTDFGSIAILASSQGGGGGTGGSVWTGVLDAGQTGKQTNVNVNLAVGGDGGNGGKADSVSVANTAPVTTLGNEAIGIFAQSVGGSGGIGGSNFNILATSNSDSQAINLDFQLGGAGGDGAESADVMVSNSGAISTSGGDASAIYAQSVGGNGGRGGNSANMSLNLDTKLLTTTGLTASGGDLEFAEIERGVTSQEPPKKKYNIDASILIGGAGGGGAHGESVTVENAGQLTTESDGAWGIFAQSIGGNGGEGGSAAATSLSWSGLCGVNVTTYLCALDKKSENPEKEVEIEYSFEVNVGGSGGSAADGGTVKVTNEASIVTEGAAADAISAQSVGGGGGDGGKGGSDGFGLWTSDETAKELEEYYDLVSSDPFSDLKPNSFEVSIGGNGGASGNGASVEVLNTESLKTFGQEAYGIDAQSVGGGGGSGGKAGASWTYSIVVGGTGSGGGDGGKVTVENSGGIETSGYSSIGIHAQSVGKGGGNGGNFEAAFSWLSWEIPIGLVVTAGGESGDGGDGGDVLVKSNGAITTIGENAHGIWAQSVGGSGGSKGVGTFGLVDLSAGDYYAGNVGGTGSGGSVKVEVGAPISVSGQGALGVFAQSVGGPDEKNARDIASDVTIMIDADVSGSGPEGRAIVAQSVGGAGNGTITVDVAEGVTVSSASDGYETMTIYNGNDESVINNKGLITRPDGNPFEQDEQGYTILALNTEGLTIHNEGTIHGSIRFFEGAKGSILNLDGGLLELSQNSTLAGSGRLINDGRLTAGGRGEIGSAQILGNSSSQMAEFVNNGIIQVDYQLGDGADEEAKADRLSFDAARVTAKVGGQIEPNAVGVNLVENGTIGSFAVLSGLSPDDFAATLTDDAIVNWTMREETVGGALTIVLDYEVETLPWLGFTTPGYDQQLTPEEARRANDNVVEVGTYVDDLIEARLPFEQAGEPELAFVDELTNFLLRLNEIGTLVDVYESWTPQIAAAPNNAALFSSVRFTDSLQACPRFDETGVASFAEEGNCIWLRAQGGSLQRQENSDAAGFTEDSFGFEGGVQMETLSNLFAGIGFLFEDASLDGDGSASGSGQRYQAGVVLRNDFSDGFTLSGAFTGGISDYDLSRQVFTPDGDRRASSSPTLAFVAGQVGVAKTFTFESEGPFNAPYLKPTGEVGVIHQWQDSYSEGGAGDYGATVEDLSQTFVTLNPYLEAGGNFELFGLQARSYGRAGILAVLGGDDLDAQLNGALDGGPDFTIDQGIPTISGDLALGLEVATQSNISFRIEGSALLAEDQQSYFGVGRITLHF